MNLFAFFLTLFSLLGSFVVQAAPLNKRDVYVPRILDPHAGTVWTSGQQATVTWDTSNPPKQITNRKGLIILRKGETELPGECDQYNISWKTSTNSRYALVVLADGFDILDGKVSFIVPKVFADKDYSIVCEWKCSHGDT